MAAHLPTLVLSRAGRAGLAAALLPLAAAAQPARTPPACPDGRAEGKHAPTIDDVLRLRGEGMSRQSPFAANDLRADGQRVAVQLKRPMVDARAHATWSYRWLNSDVLVLDAGTGREVAALRGGATGESWATPTWSPSGRQLAVVHVGAASLDREPYLWDVGTRAPRPLAPGTLTPGIRIGVGVPNGLAGSLAWLDSTTLIAATLPAGSGLLDVDEPMVAWPKAWAVATSGAGPSASVIDVHLPPSIPPAHPTPGVPLTLWRIDTRTGARRALLTAQAARGRTPRDALLSPDRALLALALDVRGIDASAGPMPILNRAETELMLVDVRSGRTTHPLPGRHALLVRWTPDGASVGVRIVAPAGDTLVQVRRDGTVDRSAARVIATGAAVPRDSVTPTPAPPAPPAPAPAAVPNDRPRVAAEIDGRGARLVLRRGKSARTLLTVDESIATLAVCRPWYVRYTTQAGVATYARVTMPPGWAAGHRYPALVQMYPGTVHVERDARSDTMPYVASGQGWDPVLFAAHGYVVVEPSMPLSGGGADRAPEFSGDILPALDSLIAYGVVDSTRMAIDGVSFGGFGTAMVVEQTNRFRAASARHGLYDLVSMYGMFNPARRLADDAGEHLWAPGWAEPGQGHLGVPPYGHWETFQRASPLYGVERIETPLLLVAGDMDYAAPLAQSEEMFTALNRLGKPARFIRYAGEGHGNAAAANIRHLFLQMAQWYDAWLKPDAH